MNTHYPPGPASVPAGLATPSPTYHRRAWLAVASLALFVGLYVALSAWFVWTAWRMFADLGAGDDTLQKLLVGGSAAFLALFMLKALFFVRKGGAPDAVEITETEQPRLFAFLYRLADEAGAPRPRKVFLSARVNAMVFYDLSILNLLFPSAKNLEIGLALVNVLTLSEMKAVLAHEFGHFAQRSMAIGSWVYIAQQIASHVIAKRDALDKALRIIASIDLRVAWIGWLLQLIVWSIRSLMDTALRLVVLAQRALSRQMEFQADLVAVSLTGSDELVHALHKLQAADDAWGRTLGFAHAQIGQGKLPHDLFEVQSLIIDKVSRILDDETYGRAPRPDTTEPAAHRVFKAGFAQPPQMWATHPANADREHNAKQRYVAAPHDPRSAWTLFDEVDTLRTRVVAPWLAGVKAEPASRDDSLAALDARYALLQYASRFRGTYLGRPVTRHAGNAVDLYAEAISPAQVRHTLASLYGKSLAEDLVHLRELDEEAATLRALHDKVFKPNGGRIVFRGREIARHDLPAAMRTVSDEAEEVRNRVLTHDRRCRSAHLAAAALVGGRWREYLIGLIQMLHYAEHSLADLQDAHGLLGNVVAVVTADGKVSATELDRLIREANRLHATLTALHGHKEAVQLDARLAARLEVPSWAEALEPCPLPPASRDNINEWMQAIDGWVGAATHLLGALVTQTLELLLQTEDELATHVRKLTQPDPAPAPSAVPPRFARLVPGAERKRQTKLGLWDRFQTADGLFAATGRFATAGAIVAAVLGAGSLAGSTAALTLYNGLGLPVTVTAGQQTVTLAPFSSTNIDIPVAGPLHVVSTSPDGEVIDSFDPELSGHGDHYIYNVAGAAPLVRWTATYGNASEVPPQMLGAPRWASAHVDIYFADAPQTVRTKGGGATRSVLTGTGERPPEEVLGLVESDAERLRIVRLHARWDRNQPHTPAWREMALRTGPAS